MALTHLIKLQSWFHLIYTTMVETFRRLYSELELGVEVGSAHTVLALALAALDLAGVVP